MRERIAFLHLPKSAGSSVRRAIATAAGPERVAPYQLDRTLFGGFDRFDAVPPHVAQVVLREDPARLADHDVALGHFAWSTLAAAFGPGDVVCLLREPRARLVSHFWFWFGWTEDQHVLWEPYRASRVPAEHGWTGFLTDPSVAAQTDHLTLRLLLAPDPRIPPDDFIDGAHLDDLAHEAIARIDSLGHADVIDTGGGFWTRLSDWIGTELQPVRDNVTPPDRSEFDWSGAIGPRSEAALAARTRGDRAVWDHVLGRRAPEADAAAVADAAYVGQIAKVAAARPPGRVSEPAEPAEPAETRSTAELTRIVSRRILRSLGDRSTTVRRRFSRSG